MKSGEVEEVHIHLHHADLFIRRVHQVMHQITCAASAHQVWRPRPQAPPHRGNTWRRRGSGSVDVCAFRALQTVFTHTFELQRTTVQEATGNSVFVALSISMQWNDGHVRRVLCGVGAVGGILTSSCSGVCVCVTDICVFFSRKVEVKQMKPQTDTEGLPAVCKSICQIKDL